MKNCLCHNLFLRRFLLPTIFKWKERCLKNIGFSKKNYPAFTRFLRVCVKFQLCFKVYVKARYCFPCDVYVQTFLTIHNFKFQYFERQMLLVHDFFAAIKRLSLSGLIAGNKELSRALSKSQNID